VMHEHAQNGVDTLYQRDTLGLPTRITVHAANGAAIYDVASTRDASNNLTAIADLDGVGLDHSAQFTYDGFARLTGASIGGFTFGYAYDALHNMTSRTQTGPRTLGAFTGAYHYAEAGRAPRQLTSIADASGAVLHHFDYDAAGRQIAQDGLALSFDATDRLVGVTGLPNGTLQHAYGATGERVRTIEPDGSVAYFFGDGVVERNGVREHDVTIGERVVARVAVTPTSPGGPAGGFALGAAGLALCGGAGLLLAFARSQRRTRRWMLAGATAILGGCSSHLGVQRQAVDVQATFLHAGFAAGPAVVTDATGNLLEERRTEPFGVPIDATSLDVNTLNKRTEPSTGWSDHGARWLAPETARWLSTDPPVEGPSEKFMSAPWAMHPYQYVDSNPVAYWDPDGRCSAPVLGPNQVGICIEAFIGAARIDIFGEGNDRGFEGNDPSLTAKISQQITIDQRTFELGESSSVSRSTASAPGWLAAAVATYVNPIGGLLSYHGLTVDATGETRVYDQTIDAGRSSTTFTAGGRGANGYQRSFLTRWASPGGSIDYSFTFQVSSAGDVTLLNGGHKAFPSYAVYAYKRAANGAVYATTLHEAVEHDKSDLKADFDGLHEKPAAKRGVETYYSY
jgi:RHS repeat-associated protein